MLDVSQTQQLQSAARFLWQQGVIQTLPYSSLVCLLALLADDATQVDVNHQAKRLHWSLKRTRRALQGLTYAQMNGQPLMRRVPGTRQESGRFSASRYRLMLHHQSGRGQGDQTARTSECGRDDVQKERASAPVASALPRDFPPSLPADSPSAAKGKARLPQPPPANLPVAQEPEPSNNNGDSSCNEQPSCRRQPSSASDEDGENAFQHQQPAMSPGRPELIQKLKRVGLTDESIQEMLNRYSLERIQAQLGLLAQRNVRNPAGFLIRAIREDWAASAPHQERKKEETEETTENPAMEALEKTKQEEKQAKQRQRRLQSLRKQLTPDEESALFQEAEQRMRKRLRKAWPKERPIPQTFLKDEFYRLLEEKHQDQEPSAEES